MENTQSCPNVNPDVTQILQRLSQIDAILSLQKSIYAEQNQLVKQLREAIGVDAEVTLDKTIYKVVDQFANKEVVFRPAAVRRFELVTESVADRAAKIAKALKK
jgi:hypothetical protein